MLDVIVISVAATAVYVVGWFVVFGFTLVVNLSWGTKDIAGWKVVLAATFWPLLLLLVSLCVVLAWIRRLW